MVMPYNVFHLKPGVANARKKKLEKRTSFLRPFVLLRIKRQFF